MFDIITLAYTVLEITVLRIGGSEGGAKSNLSKSAFDKMKHLLAPLSYSKKVHG